MLHIVNKSPFTAGGLASCLRVAKPGSAILLIEDGVYATLDGTRVSDDVRAATATFSVYALQPDVAARGIAGKVMEGIEMVDYDAFVDLVTGNDSVQSWL